jgi:hypothetical protein
MRGWIGPGGTWESGFSDLAQNPGSTAYDVARSELDVDGPRPGDLARFLPGTLTSATNASQGASGGVTVTVGASTLTSRT